MSMSKSRSNFSDLKSQICRAISSELRREDILPAGFSLSTEIRYRKSSRKVRSDAPVENWYQRPERYELVVTLEPEGSSARLESPLPVAPPPQPDEAGRKAHEHPDDAVRPAEAAAGSVPPDPVTALVSCLDRMERKSTLQFMALKHFRDVLLPHATGWDKARSEAVLNQALRDDLIRAKKVPNPKSPFPTTAIELNRQHPAVQRILGGSPVSAARFQPVAIQGEPLSQTVIRERR